MISVHPLLLALAFAPQLHAGLNTWTRTPLAGVRVYQVLAPTSLRLYARTDFDIHRSTDGGAGWMRLTRDGAPLRPTSMASPSSAPDVLLVAGASGLFRSTDGGGTWSLVGADGLIGGAAATSIAVDPADPSVLLAATKNLNVFLSRDAGSTWSSVLDGGHPYRSGIGQLAVLSGTPRMLLATYGSNLSAGVLSRSEDATSWTDTATSAPPASLAAAPTNGSWSVVAGGGCTPAGRFLSSADAGRTWQSRDLPLAGCLRHLALAPSRPTTLVLGTDTSVFLSLDGGQSIRTLRNGLPDLLVLSIAVDPLNPERFWLGTDRGLYTMDRVPLSITSIEPRSGDIRGGTEMTLTGDGFADGAAVTFDGLPAEVTSVSARSLRIKTPPHPAGAVTLALAIGTDQSATAQVFTYEGSCAAPPRAVVSGGIAICAGTSGTIRVDVSGTPPFRLYWSDGYVQTTAASPVFRILTPASTARYTVAVVSDALCVATGEGGATIDIGAVPPMPSIETSRALVFTGRTLTATARSRASDVTGHRFEWSIEGGSITSGDGTPVITFTSDRVGVTIARVKESSSLGCVSPPGEARVTVADADRVVPVVVDTPGRFGSYFTTELTLFNASTFEPEPIRLEYRAALGFGSGVVAETLAPSELRAIPDVVAYLRSRGVPIPVDGLAHVGTLRVTQTDETGPNEIVALARTTTPSGAGRAGLGYQAVAPGSALVGKGYVFGLRETASERTNLALVNPGRAPLTLRVTLVSPGGQGGEPLPPVTLSPGEWRQLDSVLALRGLADGYAVVEPADGGSGSYIAYAVLNDNRTNDGSYVAGVAGAPVGERLLPVLVESDRFETELTLANPSAEPVTAVVVFREAVEPGAFVSVPVSFPLGAGEQLVLPRAVTVLRERAGVTSPKPTLHAQAALVRFEDAAGRPRGGYAAARVLTAAPFGGGRYGVSFDSTPVAELPMYAMHVVGLRQDGATRSNLALVNAEVDRELTFRIRLLDETGKRNDLVVASDADVTVTLGPGEWTQIDSILSRAAVRGRLLELGTAEVSLAQAGRFLAYGVINDGARPGLGTGDGTFVPMSR